MHIKKLVKSNNGVTTVEIVIVIAVLVVLALLFKDRLLEFANALFDKLLNPDSIEQKINV